MSDPAHRADPAGWLPTRRSLLQATTALGGSVLAGQALGGPASRLEAFAGATSVKAGGSLDLYARNPLGSATVATTVPLTIGRLGAPDRLMLSTTMRVFFKAVPADASANGCRSWGVAHRLSIPANWPSGLYWATLGSGDAACTVPFVVRPRSRSPGASVLVQVPVTTAQAYNNYGGKSLYEYNSTGGVRGTRVSFNRPFADPFNFAFDPWQPPFIRWLESNGITADYCTSMDLHQDATLLSGYRLFTTAGHDEYWSRTMRDRLDSFVASGGNAAIFSGNTCWWQVRFDDNGGNDRRMVCFKSRTADTGGTAATKTTYWADLVPPYPENSTIGVSYLKGASWTNGLPRPQSPYIVQQPNHWAFAGTGLAAGAAFGAPYVGYEADGVDFRTGGDGRFYATGLDGSPASLSILAQADCSDWDARAKALGLSGEWSGHAAIALFSRGGNAGTVFNAATTDWAYGLLPELQGQSATAIGTITRNVFNRLKSAWQEPAEVRRWHAVLANGQPSLYYTAGTETQAGMALHGEVFRAHAGPVAGSAPVYRYRAGPAGSYRWALGRAAQPVGGGGWTQVGVAFHAFASAAAGRVPVYQVRGADPLGQPLMGYTTNLAIVPAGWVNDGVAFYALASA